MASVKLAGVDEFGVFHEKNLDHIVDDLKIYFRIYHGPDVGLDEGDIDLQLIESVAPEFRFMWAAFGGAWLQAFISTATGEALEKACAILRITRKLASKSTGEATFTRTTPAPVGGITIPAGTIIATEGDVRFTTDADATIAAGGTNVTVAITAVEAGSAGNVGGTTITDLVSTVPGVDTVSNTNPTTGGSERESDDSLRARALNDPAARGKATPRAIKAQIAAVPGVTQASVLVNKTSTVGTDKDHFLFTGTGTDSALIQQGGTNTKIAQKFVIGNDGAWMQDVEFYLTNVTGLTLTTRVETDSAGSASGALATTESERTGIAAVNGLNAVHFSQPIFLAAGTYHLVLVPTAGSFNLDGATTGTADQIKIFTGGAYTATGALIENGRINVIGGLPPHSVEVFVTGGVDDDIAEQLFDVVAGGIETWGDTLATVTDDSGNEQEVRFSRPTTVTIYVIVEIVPNDDWDATTGPNAVRDAIVHYIGGTDTTGSIYGGLDPGDDVIRAEIIAAIMAVTGVKNIGVLKIDKVNPAVATTGDVAIATTEVARAETVANIDVTTI